MKKIILPLATVALLALPSVGEAQLGVAGRVGTLGLGGEAALGLGDLVIRGGKSFKALSPSATISDIDVTLTLPETWYNIGLDLYLGSSFRIGGGILFKTDDPTLEGNLGATTDLGGTEYTPDQIGMLTGVLDYEDKATYALIGFGKHTARGLGLFLDLGVAFTGAPVIDLDSTEGSLSGSPGLEASLEAEARQFEEDLGSYLEYWPILSIGLRFGIGG